LRIGIVGGGDDIIQRMRWELLRRVARAPAALAATTVAAALAAAAAAVGAPPRAAEPPREGIAGVRGSRLARVAFPDGRTYLAEVARTPDERARGLMFRRSLGEQEGMVFLFEEPAIYPFWMKNTLIPLDILWLDDAGKVVHLERSVPPCRLDPCPSVVPLKPATWVLEVGAGRAAGVSVGDRLLVAPEPSPEPTPPSRR
jgi:hypothetical protein